MELSRPDSGHKTLQPERIPFVSRLLATGFFTGYSPWASGTVGTITGIVIYLIPGMENGWILLAATILFFFAGVVTSAQVAKVVGHQLTKSAAMAKEAFQKEHDGPADPSIVVIDEIVGIWITLLFLPKTLVVIGIGFVAFRAFDILKPYPAARLEHIPNGWGIMLDDVAAGVYAHIATRIALAVLPAGILTF